MIILRDYQLEAVTRLWAELYVRDTALCVLPTGGGKTEIMIELLRKSLEAKPDVKIVVLLNRLTLVDQTHKRFSRALNSQNIGIYCGSRDSKSTSNSITIASIQSIYDIELDKVHLIVLDEAHNVDENEGRYFEFLTKLKAKNDKLKVVAFTATPFRATGKIYGDGKMFPDITYRKFLTEMIDAGYLVKPSMKRGEHQFDTSKLRIQMGEYRQDDVARLTEDEDVASLQVSDALSRMSDRRKIVWACSTIKHCEMVSRLLNEMGEQAKFLHSKQKPHERMVAQYDFESGDIRHLVFVSIVSEGYDYPPIDCVVLMRPMRSPVLYVQTVGRGLRIAEGKRNLLVLDYGRVVETIGPLDDPVIVDPSKKTKKGVIEIQMKFCPQCFEYVAKILQFCPMCQHMFYEKEVTAIQKLNSQADELSTLLAGVTKSNQREHGIIAVTLHPYKSKGGNDCLLIVYHTDHFYRRTINEYFVWENEVGYKRAQRRLIELNVDIKATLTEQSGQVVKKTPESIVVEDQGRFVTVKELKFA